jgi:hypothetical protein
MHGKEIEQCFDLDVLEIEEEKVYSDCVRINNCNMCFHRNNDRGCDFELLTKQFQLLTKK